MENVQIEKQVSTQKIKHSLTKIGLLLFPLTIALPLPLIVNTITLGVFFATLFFNLKTENVSFKNIAKEKIVIAFLLLYLLETILPIFRGQNLYFNELKTTFIIAPILFFFSKNLLNTYKTKILNVFVISVFGYIVFAVGYVTYFYSISVEEFGFNYYLKYVTYHHLPFAIHHTYIGMYVCFAGAIILFKKTLLNYKKYILYFILFASIFIIGSKLSILVMVLIFCFYQIHHKIKISFLKLIKVLGVFLISSVIGIIFLFTKTDLFRTLEDSINIRKDLFWCTLEGIKSNIFIGIGNDNVKQYISNCSGYLGRKDTHNLFLQEFISNGMLGVTILIYLMYIVFKSQLDRRVILGMILISILVLFGFVEHILDLQYGVVFFCFFVLLFYFTGENKDKIKLKW